MLDFINISRLTYCFHRGQDLGDSRMNIYVGNLSYGMTDSALEAMFTQFGSVSESKIIIDRETGRSKGFGFVEMSNNQEGEEAIRQLNGKEIEGRAIRVNEAKPQAERPARRGNGGGGSRY